MGLVIVDISDPRQPRVVQNYKTPSIATDVYVAGHLALVTSRTHGVWVIDVSNPLQPADDWAGMRIADISDPSSPRVVGHVDTPGNAERITVSGNRAYIADGTAGLRIIDVSSPMAPNEVAAFDTPGYAWNVRVLGDLVYVADGDQGLRIIDASKPSAPREVASYKAPATTSDVWVADSGVYVAAYEAGLMILNLDAQQ